MSVNNLSISAVGLVGQFETIQYQADDEAHTLLKQINGLQTIKILCRLTQAVQKHRGASIACINGESQFISMVEQLQIRVKKLLRLLMASADQYHTVSSIKLSGAISDWESILSGWSEDDIIENYEFHSHLVEVLYNLSRQCIEDCNMYIDPSERDIVLSGLLNGIPVHIESLARLRGLVTYAAKSGSCDHDCYIRISYLHKKVLEDFRALNRELKQLHHGLPKVITLDDILEQEYHLTHLLELVEKNILKKRISTAKADEMFTLSTTIIDRYWSVVDHTILLTEKEIFSKYLHVDT